jgi:hypothetical protein
MLSFYRTDASPDLCNKAAPDASVKQLRDAALKHNLKFGK